MTTVPHRPIQLVWQDDTRACWQPIKPEFAAAVNALSLGMPYGEPYVMKAVRDALPDVDDQALKLEVNAYLEQEQEHSKQHRRFNKLLVAQHPALRHVERWLKWSYGFLTRRMSRKFAVSYAAGFEATAFAAARWMDSNRHALFRGADPEPATLILWHLAEEVEHKTVAHDVWAAVDGNRLRYATAMALCFVMLVWFIFCGVMVQLTAWRRVLSPVAWFRLWKWGLGFAFEVVPTMAITLVHSHDPRDQADPSWMPLWLAAYDDKANTIPPWDAPLDAYLHIDLAPELAERTDDGRAYKDSAPHESPRS